MPTPQSDAGCAGIARARRRGHLAKSARPWRCAAACRDAISRRAWAARRGRWDSTCGLATRHGPERNGGKTREFCFTCSIRGLHCSIRFVWSCFHRDEGCTPAPAPERDKISLGNLRAAWRAASSRASNLYAAHTFAGSLAQMMLSAPSPSSFAPPRLVFLLCFLCVGACSLMQPQASAEDDCLWRFLERHSRQREGFA